MEKTYKQPKTLKLLLAAEFTERSSFWGLQSILVLYLTRAVNLPLNEAYLTYGTCSALTFALSVLGGILADRLLGFHRALLIGIFLVIIGNLTLIIPKTGPLYVGLALIICGTALFVPNNSNLLGTFYEHNDPNRSKCFYLLYMCANLGGFLGPIIYGIIATRYGWHYSFIFSVSILVLCLVWFFLKKKQFVGKDEIQNSTNENNSFLKKYYLIFLYGSIFFTIFSVWLIIQNSKFFGIILSIVGIFSFIGLSIVIYNHNKEERKSIITLLMMMSICLLFFAIEFQVNSSLILFSDQYVDRHFLNWQIPSNAFAAFEPLFIIILSPLLGFILPILCKKIPSAISMLVACLLLESASFFVFYLAGHSITSPDQKISLNWILLGNLLLGAGEVCLMPTLISSVVQLAPKKLKGTLMGTLYLFIAFSSYASGLVAMATTQHSVSNKTHISEYTNVYMNLAQFTLLVASCILLFLLLRMWYRHVKLPVSS